MRARLPAGLVAGFPSIGSTARQLCPLRCLIHRGRIHFALVSAAKTRELRRERTAHTIAAASEADSFHNYAINKTVSQVEALYSQ